MQTEPRPVALDTYLGQPSEQGRLLAQVFPAAAPLVILDIGGCEGEDSIRYARQFPHARIFTFEPLPQNQAIIRENFQRYGIARAELIPAALSDSDGSATFHVSTGKPRDLFCGESWNYGNKSSSLLPPAGETPMHGWIEFKESITVPTRRLDGFLASRGIAGPDFIHMDVQGAELLVLQGAGAALDRTAAVWMEVADRAFYQGQPLRAEITRFMQTRGFHLLHETWNMGEGDQFYINWRQPRCWPILANSLIRRLARTLRKTPPAGPIR